LNSYLTVYWISKCCWIICIEMVTLLSWIMMSILIIHMMFHLY